MLNQETHICRDYVEAIFDRADKPMGPVDFAPNWKDQPSRFKIYDHVNRFPLSTQFPTRLASMADIFARIAHPHYKAQSLTLEDLSTILQFSLGLLNRRLGINWNHGERSRARYHESGNSYGRGTTSGGAMYPTEVYWACGQSGPYLPGLYHYAPGHHALERLFVGDMTRSIREAVFDHPFAASTDQFLLISLDFWKNAFKYSNFCYHVVTEDLGALLCSFRFLAAGFGTDLSPIFWYQDEPLNRLLGLETLEESVFAVIPLPMVHEASCMLECEYALEDCIHVLPELDEPLFKKSSFQRSKEIVRFPLIETTHLATLIEVEPRPTLLDAFNAGVGEIRADGERVDLPPPALDLLQCDLLQAFQMRQSSFGRFSKHVPLSREELATMLAFGTTVCNYGADVKRADGTPHFTRLVVFVNNVEGIERGAFAYDSEQHCLWKTQKGDFSHFLQWNYLLKNYNLLETGALIAIVGSPDRMLEVYGNRGYRIFNAEVGMVAQSIYMAASSLSVGCGAALGFNNRALNTVLGYDGTDQRTILFLLIGHERQGNADFDFRLI